MSGKIVCRERAVKPNDGQIKKRMSLTSPQISYSRLLSIASKHGLACFGITSSEPLFQSLDPLERWKNRGFAAGMQYMQKETASFCQPQRLNPGAKSVFSVAIAYQASAYAQLPLGFGRVARYAWGRDYHLTLKVRLHSFLSELEITLNQKLNACVCSDAVPVLERALSQRAALGVVGKNGMLIRQGYGSFFLLAEILWDLDVTEVPECQPKESCSLCGSCQKCMTACPAGALVEACVLDAGKCISYLSIEKKGVLTIEERELLGEWVFGCDLCQEVCPHNQRVLSGAKTDINSSMSANIESQNCSKGLRENGSSVFAPQLDRELTAEFGVGPYLDLKSVLAIRKESEFLARFSQTALTRARRAGLLRNAAIVAANSGCEHLMADLKSAFEMDASPTVRRHALWALVKLAQKGAGLPNSILRGIIDKALHDPDSGVVEEAQSLNLN